MKKALWTILAAAMAICAGLQLNDPDPLYWVVAYGGTALACLHFGFGVGPRAAVWLVLGLAAGGALTAAPGFFNWLSSGDSLYAGMGVGDVEAAREFIGIAVACAILAAGLLRR